MHFRHCWLVLGVFSCAGAQEPERVELPVKVADRGVMPVETDLGYEVTLSEARLVIDDLQFTIAGEAHAASVWQRCADWLVPAAHAHPGHYEGGDVTGELAGHFVLDLMHDSDGPLGMATLIVGSYTSTNFTFGMASAADGLPTGDVLIGHTARLRGRATMGDQAIDFSAVLDAPPGRQLVGAPFEVEVSAASAFDVNFQLMTRDPLEGDTLFDGIPFADLPRDEGSVEMGAGSTDAAMIEAYNTLHRTFQTHDHFRLVVQSAE